jgi:hypothetical protein
MWEDFYPSSQLSDYNSWGKHFFHHVKFNRNVEVPEVGCLMLENFHRIYVISRYTLLIVRDKCNTCWEDWTRPLKIRQAFINFPCFLPYSFPVIESYVEAEV